MLYQLIDDLCARIDGLDAEKEVPQFIAQMTKMRPGLAAELQPQGTEPERVQAAITILAAAQFGIIKGLPQIAREMATRLRSNEDEPAFRCVLAASLAYLVQPQDLLPDNLPGGYGYVDDALLLYEACAISWDLSGNTQRAQEYRKAFQFIYMCVPDAKYQLFQAAVVGFAQTLSLMRMMDPILAETTTQTIIANPLQPVGMQGAAGQMAGLSPLGGQLQGFAFQPGFQYTWQDGSNMGVMFPDGGGVATDGVSVFDLSS